MGASVVQAGYPETLSASQHRERGSRYDCGASCGEKSLDSKASGVRNRLIGLVKQLIGVGVSVPEPFPLKRQLSDLGISSLKMVNLMLAVEGEFDLSIPQGDITPENFRSIASIEALLARLLGIRP